MIQPEKTRTHRFTLVVDGPDIQGDRVIDALFEAGCDDALAARANGIQYVEFDREAATAGEAIGSAVRDVEKVCGVKVVRVLDAPLVTLQSTTARRQVSPQRSVSEQL